MATIMYSGHVWSPILNGGEQKLATYPSTVYTFNMVRLLGEKDEKNGRVVIVTLKAHWSQDFFVEDIS